MSAQTYLGDAVYVHTDGDYVVLTANPGGNEQTIYLEPDVLEQLRYYVAMIPAAEATP